MFERSAAGGRGRCRTAAAWVLLASTALVAGPTWAETEREIGVTLAPSANPQTVSNLSLTFERSPGIFGLAPQIEALGAAAPGPGSFDLRLNGIGLVRGSVSEFRVYDLLPVGLDELARFFARSETSADVLGAIGDAGAGNDRIRVNGTLSVLAEASLRLLEFDMDGLQGLEAFWADPLSGGPTARARGLASPLGNNHLENAGSLTAGATAAAERLDLLFALGPFGDRPQVMVATAGATAIEGGTGNDQLANLEGATLTASAEADAKTLGISVAGVTILNPQNATQARASATGMAGGADNDSLENAAGATIEVEARARVQELEISASLVEIGLPEVVLEVREEESLALATAVGMAGGAGHDQLTNAGVLRLTSAARQERLAIGISDAGIDVGAILFIIDGRPDLPDRPEGGARADLVGMSGGAGSDVLQNSGDIDGAATANASLIDIAIAVPFNDLAGAEAASPTSILGAFSLGLTDLSTDSSTFVRGLEAGGGSNVLANSGRITLSGAADSRTTGVNFDVSGAIPAEGGAPVSIGLNVTNVGANSYSEVIGMAGGGGIDRLVNFEDGLIDLTGTAFSLGTFVDFRVTYSSDFATDIDGSILLARLVAGTDVVGLSGGTGFGQLANEGTIRVDSRATTRTTDVTIDGQMAKSGGLVNAPVVDVGLLADARATGLRSDDLVTAASSTGTLDLRSEARVASVSVGIGVAATTSGGLGGSARLVNAEQRASATTIGFDRLTPAPGSDLINSQLPQPMVLGGRADANALAVASRIGVAVDLGIAKSGVGLGLPVLFAENRGEATAALVRGSPRESLLFTSGALVSRADATATSVTVALGLGGAANGVGAGGAAMLGTTAAHADAQLFDTGGGPDEIRHDADALANARASARSTGVSVSGAFAKNGVAAGVSFLDLDTNSVARASGARLGDGDDLLVGSGRIAADARAESILNGIGVNIDFAVNGVGIGAAFGDISPVATAVATAVDLGDGDDVLELSAPAGPPQPGFSPHSLDARATTLARGIGVNVGLAGSYQGVGAAGAVLFQESRASSTALGATGGAGNDSLAVDGSIFVQSNALARATGVSVGIGFAVYGFFVGASAIESDVEAWSAATGLAGGGGEDILFAGRGLTVESVAEGFRESVAVSLSGGIGVGLAFNWVEGNTRARAFATGLDGDGGDSRLSTAGTTRVTATSLARGTTVGVSGTLGVSGNLFDGSLLSTARATGQFGGTGNDLLLNLAPMIVTGTATARAPSVSVSLLGANVGSFSNRATALATGLDGGTGDDMLLNVSSVTSTATSSVNAVTVSLSTGGGNVGDLSNRSTATARGLSGGGGHDQIVSAGRVESRADASAISTGVSLAGALNADSATNEAVARAVGIEGDAADGLDPGDDELRATAAVIAGATASARGTSIAVSGSFPIGGNLLSSETIAIGEAVGIAGRGGNDLIVTSSLVEATSNASVRGPSVQVNLSALVSGNLGSFDRLATAWSTGISGGPGSDSISSQSVVRATSSASAQGLAVSVGLNGFSMIGLSTAAEARSIGIDAGRGFSGSNVVTANGRIDANATASAPQTNVAVNLVGASLPETRAAAEALAIGIAGGTGSDLILATAPLTANASADVRGVSVSVTLAGGSLPDSRARAEAVASGVDAGAGNNSAVITNALNALASASSRTTTVAVSLAGAAITDAGTVSVADAAGYRGSGFDAVDIQGSGAVSANAVARADSVAASLAGTSQARLSADATAAAALVRSMSGGSDILLSRAGLVSAFANAVGTSTNVTLGGLATSTTNRVARALAVGLGGGEGDDRFLTTARLEVESRAVVQAGARNIGLVAGATGSANAAVEALAGATGLEGGNGRDVLIWQAPVRVLAQADMASQSLGMSVVGVSNAATIARTTARAISTGASGGAGDDLFLGQGRLDVDAIATSTGGTTSFTLAGVGPTSTGTLLEAQATGVDAGDGNDEVRLEQLLNLTASANGATGTTAITLAGTSPADAGTTISAGLTGVRAGAGDDFVEILGSLQGSASAVGRSRSLGIVGAGRLVGGADSVARASAWAVDGGAGNDIIIARGPINLVSTAQGQVGNVNVTVAGAGTASAQVRGEAGVGGLAGGAGNDLLQNFGRMTLTSTASLTSGSRTITVVGTARGNSRLGTLATGIGLDGGLGNDMLFNMGSALITLNVTARLNLNSATLSIAGQSLVSGLGLAEAIATGMSGGSGNDLLVNDGRLDILATSDTLARSASMTVAGAAQGRGDVGSSATAVGMAGDAGDDILESNGRMDVTARAATTTGNSSYAFAGYAGSEPSVGASATATGMTGGSGNDRLLLRSAIATVTADARAEVSSGVRVELGSGSARGAVAATGRATGMAADSGNNLLEMAGSLTVNSFASVDFAATRFAFAGGASGRIAADAFALANGITAGSGNNHILVSGTLRANATARADGSGAAGATFGNTSAASVARGRAQAYGIDGAGGSDSYTVTGRVLVDLLATARTDNRVSSGAIFSNGRAFSTSRTTLTGAGIRDSAGNTDILVTGDIVVRALGDVGGLFGVSRALAISSGSTSGVRTDAFAESDGLANATLFGIQLGSGTHRIEQRGTVRVTSFAQGRGDATATGTSAISGDGTATALGRTQGTLFGIRAGSGVLELLNSGTILVEARPVAVAVATATGVGVTVGVASSSARATARADNIEAVGVQLGSGRDIVNNSGIIRTIVAPQATATASAQSAGSASLKVDASATATATADNARGWGIRDSGGNNEIVNSGTIDVRINPFARAEATSRGRGPFGNATSTTSAHARNALGVGIETGAGNDLIVNSGLIQVLSSPSASTLTTATAGELCVRIPPEVGPRVCQKGNERRNLSSSTSVQRVGIRTGAGNDTVINTGTINVGGGGIAIDTGPGNDLVWIQGGSVTGIIDLGPGDDIFRISGGTVGQEVRGGAGNNLLHLIGAGVLNGGVSGFPNLLKQGAGAYTIGRWDATGVTRIEEGRVNISSVSVLGVNHRFETFVAPGGDRGVLAFSGGTATLRGAIAVEARPGVYVNGTAWDVVETNAFFSGNFSTVSLPTATALRSFVANQFSNRFRVTVIVNSMQGMVSGTTEASFAAALDAATPMATGAVAQTIAGLQSLPTEEAVAGAIATMTPRLPVTALVSGAGALEGALELVADRQGMLALGRAPLRAGFGIVSGEGAGPMGWAARFDTPLAARAGAGRGDTIGFASGLDLPIGGGATVGLAVVRQVSGHALSGDSGGGTSESVVVAAHLLAPLTERLSLASRVATGSNRFRGMRAVTGPGHAGTVRLDETGRMFAVEAGLELDIGDAPLVPRLALSIRHREATLPAYREGHAGGLGLLVDGGAARTTESLLGATWAVDAPVGGAGARLQARLATAWVHRLSGADRVTARFADMPDFTFDLATGLSRRDRLAVDAGLELRLPSGAAFTLSAVGHAGDPGREQAVRAAVRVPF